MKSAWMRTKHLSPITHHFSLTVVPLLLLILAPASCGPEPQNRWAGFSQHQPGQPAGPLAGGVTPFPAGDRAANPDQSLESDAVSASPGVDQRVQSFVAQFPPDDRDHQVRPTPSQSPNPATQPAGQPLTAKPPAAPDTIATTTLATKATPAPITRATGANRPVVQAMRPAELLASSSPTTQPARMDIQASPQPMTNKMLLPLPEPGRPKVEIIDVRPAAGATTMPSAAEPLSSANQPVQHVATTRPADLGAVLAGLEETVKAHPEQLDDQFKLRLLYLATDQDEKAAGPISAGDPPQARLATTLFEVLSATKAAIRQPASAPAPALLAADELRRLLGQQSPVVIPKIALVRGVNSFGDYEAVNPPKFPAGQGVAVFLYTEVANFRSEPIADGRLRTLLAEKVEIFNSAGKVIWQQAADSIEDKVFSPRRDFFIPLEVRLPAETPPGEYVLKVTIEDKLGATTDQRRLTFTIE